LPDANRAKPASSRPAVEPPLDPRAALAQQYLAKAQSKLAAEEAAAPRAARRAATAHLPDQAGLSLSIEKSIFAHVLLSAAAITFVALMLLLIYAFMSQTGAPGGMIGVVVQSIAIPAGLVAFALLSYVSVCFLGIVESTSRGHTEVRDALYGGWREWFWTLPSTAGMLILAAAVGWALSYFASASVWPFIFVTVVLGYPILQLSTLETGSPLAPVSLAVVRSLVLRPVAWLVFYVISVALLGAIWLVAVAAWRDPPYVTMLVVGPIVTGALFFYGWLLGQLANFISSGDTQ
jgi:hypothetical protein